MPTYLSGGIFKKLRSTSNTKKLLTQVVSGEVPLHVAIIMDGNGRWAKEKGLPRILGHHAGMETLKKIVSYSCQIKLPILTFYAFSTENWHRPQEEINFLMQLPGQYLRAELSTLMKKNVRVRMIGSIDGLPKHTQLVIRKAIEKTGSNTGLLLNFALNYGGRDEIVFAVRRIVKKVLQGEVAAEEINENLFSQYLFTAGLPDPDLLVRPSGEMRLSNFLLWQSAYTELWFSSIYWPDFEKKHLLQAIYEYQQRDRRYGGIKP